MHLYSRCPVDSIRDAVLTVSPNKQYLGILIPTTPAAQGPGRIQANTNSKSSFSIILHNLQDMRKSGGEYLGPLKGAAPNYLTQPILFLPTVRFTKSFYFSNLTQQMKHFLNSLISLVYPSGKELKKSSWKGETKHDRWCFKPPVCPIQNGSVSHIATASLLTGAWAT